MAGVGNKSRWADTEDDVEADARRKFEKEEKKKLRAEKARLKEAEEQATKHRPATNNDRHSHLDSYQVLHAEEGDTGPPHKRQKLQDDDDNEKNEAVTADKSKQRPLLRYHAPEWGPARRLTNFERLNHIEEGSYGWVSRAREIATGEIVALKKLKMDGWQRTGFPVTGLREIQCLMAARHRHVVDLREIVVGDKLDDVHLVMEFLEHDLKTLQEEMQEPFSPSETKTLILQLTSAMDFLHENWILHRDLKTSNILMNNRGEIKIADFGMARYYGDPPPAMTQLVVTLWYRAPELLLGEERYDQAIDVWSIGCIFGELLTKDPLLQGKNEVDQLAKIFALCGIPTEEKWPGFRRLPNAKSLRLPPNKQNTGSIIRSKFPFLTSAGASLLNSLLSLNPSDRPSAKEVLQHPYFKEDPRPKSSSLFPTFPSKAGQEKRRRFASPSAPKRGDAPSIGGEAADFSGIFAAREDEETGAGFSLKLV